MLNDPSVVAKGRLIAQRHDTVAGSPISKLLPTMASDQLVVVIAVAPDIVELDVGLLLLSVRDELMYFFRNRFVTEPCKIRYGLLKHIWW